MDQLKEIALDAEDRAREQENPNYPGPNIGGTPAVKWGQKGIDDTPNEETIRRRLAAITDLLLNFHKRITVLENARNE